MADPAPATPPAPRPRRRWLRRVVKLVVVLLALGIAAPLALGLAPVRRFVAGKVSDALGRRVTIGGISAAWWSGLEIRDLEIHNPEGYVGDPLLAVDRVQVDASVLGALTGKIEARVAIDRPVVTLIQGKDGHSNLDGLGGPPKKPEEKERAGGRLPKLELRLRDGRVVAHGAPGAEAGKPDVIDALTVDAETDPSGTKHVRLAATALGAKSGGGDAQIRVEARLDGRNAGPVTASVPSLDLARLAKALGAALGVEGLGGALEVAVDLALDADGGASGKATAGVSGVTWRRGTGSVSIKAAALEVTPSRAGDATKLDVALAIQGLRATGFSNRDGGLDEPLLKVLGTVTRQKNGDLSFGDAAAPFRVEGRTLSGTLSGSARNLSSDAPEADVVAKVTVALSPTLGRLSGALSSPDDDLHGAVALEGSLQGKGGTLALHAEGKVTGLSVGGAAGTAPYTEPSATVAADGTWDGRSQTLTLARAQVGAGALRATTSGPVTFRASPTTSFTGDFAVDADLSRLAGLQALVPSLSSVQGGTVHAEVKASGGDDLTMDATVRAKSLAFTPGTLSSRGYLERDVALVAHVVRPKAGATTIEVRQLASAMASLSNAKGPVTIRLADAGPSIDGTAVLTVNLLAVGIAFDKAIGLAPGQSLSGTLDVSTSGATTADGSRFEVRLAGRDLMFPGATARGTLDGGCRLTTSSGSKTTSIEGLTLRGYGLDVKGSALFGPGPNAGPVELRTATLDAVGDLQEAKPLLAVGVSSLADATLSGALSSHVQVTAAGAGRRIDGKTTVTKLRYGSAPDPKTGRGTTLSEAAVTIEHRIAMDTEPGLVTVEGLTFAAEALSASVTGTSRAHGDDRDLNLDVRIDGDAARLADDLKNLLGEGYEDTTGEGRVAGRFTVAGSTATDGRDLRVDGTLGVPKLASAGLSVEDAKVALARPSPGTPLTLAVTARVNRGTLRVDGTCDLGKGESPWAARIAIQGLDTSPLVTGKGTGRYLALVLPAIVPADATTAVLSGLLDANVDLQSPAIRQPRLADALTGPGSLRMTQGTVKDSTLFKGLAGGGGSGGMTQLLKLVPGVGKEFGDLSRALAFQEMTSRWTIANRQFRLDPVVLVSPSFDLRFTGVVGFDGSTELHVPLRLGGEAGKAIEPYVKDRTIPLKVTQKADGPMRVVPELKLENLGTGLIDDLLGGKKKKPK